MNESIGRTFLDNHWRISYLPLNNDNSAISTTCNYALLMYNCYLPKGLSLHILCRMLEEEPKEVESDFAGETAKFVAVFWREVSVRHFTFFLLLTRKTYPTFDERSRGNV
jgi:hypothetical protein